jgi:hypothetical protein
VRAAGILSSSRREESRRTTDGCAALSGSSLILLTKALNAWGTAEFSAILKQEIEQLTVAQLPLQQGLSSSSHALDDSLRAMIISVADEGGFIRAKAGIFYAGIIAGCSCADDPAPVTEQSEYCEVRVDIDKATAGTTVVLLTE